MRVGYDNPVEAKAPKEVSQPPSDGETGNGAKLAPASALGDSDMPPEFSAAMETRALREQNRPRNADMDSEMPPEYLNPELPSLSRRSRGFGAEDEVPFDFGSGESMGKEPEGRDGEDAQLDLEMGLLELASSMEEDGEDERGPKSKL